MKIRSIFIIIFLIFISVNTYSQSGGLNFTLGFPMGEFKENVKRTGFGLSGHFLFWDPRPEMPFSFGLNIGFINYGNETRRSAFSDPIPDVTVDVDRSNNIINFHLLFQVALPSGFIRPYIEGLFGGAYLFTETSIRSRGNQEVASSTNFDDFAWSYGGGGGFMIEIYSGENNDDFGSVFLDLKARYIFGSEAEYLKEGSVTIKNGQVFYDVSRSKTDLLTAHIGVVAFFNTVY